MRERTQDTWGLWRKKILNPESNPVWRRRRWHFLRRQALQPDQKIRNITAARCSTSLSKPARRRNHLRKAIRTSAPSAWWAWWKTCARKSNRSAAKSGFQQKVSDVLIDKWPDSRCNAGKRRADRNRPRGAGINTARDTFQMLHDRGVFAEAKTVLGRLPYRTPAIADRQGALRQICRPPSCSAPPITNWCITPATAVRFTASACAPAVRWWQPPPSQTAWSPTA